MGQTHSRQQLENFLSTCCFTVYYEEHTDHREKKQDQSGQYIQVFPPIPPRPSASILAKSKHHKNIKSFAQATKGSTEDILKIKEAFPKLSTKKIIEMHNIAHDTNKKIRPKINMTTKGPSRKQIIIPMSQDNINTIIMHANSHIFNINQLLKSIKSDVMADFICSDSRGIIVTTNKIALPSNMDTIEKYIKESDNINSNNVSPP